MEKGGGEEQQQQEPKESGQQREGDAEETSKHGIPIALVSSKQAVSQK